MTNINVREFMKQYNSLFKEVDDLYHSIAYHYGLSDCALWILYLLRESDTDLTQSRICEQLFLSKQTVNSALKNLENAGYVELKSSLTNKKSRQILLTSTGEEFAKQTVDNVLLMEEHAFAQLSLDEITLFLELHKKHVNHLQTEAVKILNSAENKGDDLSFNIKEPKN